MLKSGNYHIIQFNAQSHRVRVRCHQGGRYHRHQYHIEEQFQVVCGAELVTGREDFCNVSIATPT